MAIKTTCLGSFAVLFLLASVASGGEPSSNRPPSLIFDIHTHAIAPESVSSQLTNEELTDSKFCPTSDELLHRTVIAFERHHVKFALVQGHQNLVDEWANKFPIRHGESVCLIPTFCPNVKDPAFKTLDHVRAAEEFGTGVDQGRYWAVGELLYPYDRPIEWPLFWPYLRVAEQKGIPVLFHTGDSSVVNGPPTRTASAGQLAVIAERFPKLHIVACHAGIDSFDELLQVMKAYPLVSADIATINWEPYKDKLLETALRGFKDADMLDRVYFGSDQMFWPNLIDESIQFTCQTCNTVGLSEEQQRWIFYENAYRLFRIEERLQQTSR